jgi:hypothetical protein
MTPRAERFQELILAVELEAAYMAGWRDGLAWRFWRRHRTRG